MLAEDIDKQRCIRFYQWAKSDLEREIAEDYPFLRLIPSIDAGCYLEIIQALPPPEQLSLANALFRWSHQAALTLLGETLTAEEKTLREDYLSKRGLLRSRIEQKLQTPVGEGIALKSIKFRRLIQEALEPILRTKPERGWSDLLFITPVDKWFIGTQVQTMDKGTRLRYYRCVMASETDYSGLLPSPSQNGTNTLSWLGVGRLDWEIPFGDLAEPAVEALSFVCRHYIQNISSVLDGLHPELQSSWDGIHWWQRQPAQ